MYEEDIYQGKSDDTMYKGTLTYELSDDKMIYALYSEGFRLGGFNSKKNPASVLPEEYGPDELTNVEIGIKSVGSTAGCKSMRRLYRMDFSDIQRGITDPDDWTANGTVNMGGADVSGLELEVTLYATDNFTIQGAFAVNESDLHQDVWLSELVDLTDPVGHEDQLGAKGQEIGHCAGSARMDWS